MAIMEQVSGSTPGNGMHPSHLAIQNDKAKKEVHINENRIH